MLKSLLFDLRHIGDLPPQRVFVRFSQLVGIVMMAISLIAALALEPLGLQVEAAQFEL